MLSGIVRYCYVLLGMSCKVNLQVPRNSLECFKYASNMLQNAFMHCHTICGNACDNACYTRARLGGMPASRSVPDPPSIAKCMSDRATSLPTSPNASQTAPDPSQHRQMHPRPRHIPPSIADCVAVVAGTVVAVIVAVVVVVVAVVDAVEHQTAHDLWQCMRQCLIYQRASRWDAGFTERPRSASPRVAWTPRR